jgi:hypothetical protein
LDKLYGDENYNFSDKIKIEDFLDKKFLKDKLYSDKKLLLLYVVSKSKDYSKAIHMNPDDILSVIENKDKSGFIKASDEYINGGNYKYLNSPHELYARWNTLKMDILNKGIIENINQIVTLDDIAQYLNNTKTTEEEKYDAYDILLQLDFKKIKKLQKNLTEL